MQSDETKIIMGSNVWGEPRRYTFKLLDAETGLRIFHEFATILSASYEVIEKVSSKFIGDVKGLLAKEPFEDEDTKDNSDENDLSVKDVLEMLPKVFTWPVVKQLSVDMLAEASIDTGADEPVKVGEDGICPLAKGDPLEQYAALFFAVCANYPKYVGFFGVGLEAPDSNPEAATTTQN